MHLDGALAVSDVVNFLIGDLIDVCEDGRKVIVGHMLEGELPKLFSFVRVVFGMIS